MKTYHITWLIGKDQNGLDLLTGITIEAEDMESALHTFKQKHNVEPYYILTR